MDFSALNKFNKIYPLYVETFEEFSPVDNETMTTKFNKVIQSLNRIGRLSESVVKDWNKVFEWLMNEGLEDEVTKQLVKWRDDGTFETILNVMLVEINSKVDGFQGQLDSQTTEIAKRTNKTESISTTTGWNWTTSYQPSFFTENGEKFLLDGKPNIARKKLMFVGSSVCYGQAATNLMGWANKVKATLETRGWIVKNHAIPGNSTTDVMNRFYSDIVPERPDIVVIALSLSNDGILGSQDKDATYNNFRNNMATLVRRIKQQGAIPVICTTYPRNDYSPYEVELCRQFNKEIETWGVYTINLMANVDDGTGKFIVGTESGDGAHPSDLGYEAIYKGVSLSAFENLFRFKPTFDRFGDYLYTGTDRVTVRQIQTFLSDPLDSFTVFFKLKANSGLNTKVFFSAGSNDNRLRNTNNFLEYISGSGASIMSTLNIKTDFNTHDIALSYSKTDNKVRLYVDGVLAGSVVDSIDVTSGGMTLAGNANASFNADDCNYKDFLLYRVRLSDTQITALSDGKILKGGLEIYSPLNDKNVIQNNRFANFAPTSSYLKINSTTLQAVTKIKSL